MGQRHCIAETRHTSTARRVPVPPLDAVLPRGAHGRRPERIRVELETGRDHGGCAGAGHTGDVRADGAPAIAR